MKLNNDIIKALNKAIDVHGSALEISRKTGIKHQNFSRYLSHQVKNISLENWLKLEPVVKPYMECSPYSNPSRENNSVHESQVTYANPRKDMHCSITGRAKCPFDDASGMKRALINMLESVDDDIAEKLITKLLELKNTPNTLPISEVGELSQIKEATG